MLLVWSSGRVFHIPEIYVDTEYEQASRYFECAACHQKATKDLISEVKNNVEQ